MPLGPIHIRSGCWHVTGKRRHRLSCLLHRLILQVEETQATGVLVGGSAPCWNGAVTRWRDATILDIQGDK